MINWYCKITVVDDLRLLHIRSCKFRQADRCLCKLETAGPVRKLSRRGVLKRMKVRHASLLSRNLMKYASLMKQHKTNYIITPLSLSSLSNNCFRIIDGDRKSIFISHLHKNILNTFIVRQHNLNLYLTFCKAVMHSFI